jgi:GPH family glycoside/pentoside/hexuronide:cation symporter
MRPLKKWQEPIYALGSLGSSTLSPIVLGWILFYYRPSEAEVERTGAVSLAGAAATSVVWIVARVIDGACDVPIASWSDTMRSRWGQRRPMIALGLIPLAIVFILIWYPPVRGEHWLNAIWMAVFSSAFFFCYSFVVVPYLALLSEMAEHEASRLRIASWQAIASALGMALVMIASPKLIEWLGYQKTVWLLAGPGVLCFLGPILVVRETPSNGAAPHHSATVAMPLWRSVVAALTNRTFATYMLSMGALYLGLQFFLIGQPYIVTAVMGLDKGQAGVLNVATIGLVPFALILLNLISSRKGAKWAYRLALLAFGALMLLYPLTWARLGLPSSPLALGIVFSAFASYSVATFMVVPNAFPAEIAYQDTLRTGEHRAGMYFAVQGVINQTLSAVAGVIVVQLVAWLGSSAERPYGVLFLPAIAAVLCFASWALFAPYPLGRPEREEDITGG